MIFVGVLFLVILATIGGLAVVEDMAPEAPTPATRAEVYKLIDGERDYQDEKWGATLSNNRSPGPDGKPGDRSIDEMVLYIQGYADDATRLASHYANPQETMAAIRKVAALCVKAMEQHGAPPR